MVSLRRSRLPLEESGGGVAVEPGRESTGIGSSRLTNASAVYSSIVGMIVAFHMMRRVGTWLCSWTRIPTLGRRGLTWSSIPSNRTRLVADV